MKKTIRFSKSTLKMQAWANYCSQEIKLEDMNRLSIKEKCDQILKVYQNQINMGIFTYFKYLNKDLNRKAIEFEMRMKYWNYFRTAHKYLNKYNIYFQIKIKRYLETLATGGADDEFGKDKEKYEEDLWLHFYVCELEKRLEENFNRLYEIKSKI
jgi:hypothetical protein